mmetsp:Transcript_94577/g.291585  ORF Transcript_94577/g.291585 Transcript_94577/m.291585 type:complete len:235 (+) Transcript_94577:434-1138(+)
MERVPAGQGQHHVAASKVPEADGAARAERARRRGDLLVLAGLEDGGLRRDAAGAAAAPPGRAENRTGKQGVIREQAQRHMEAVGLLAVRSLRRDLDAEVEEASKCRHAERARHDEPGAAHLCRAVLDIVHHSSGHNALQHQHGQEDGKSRSRGKREDCNQGEHSACLRNGQQEAQKQCAARARRRIKAATAAHAGGPTSSGTRLPKAGELQRVLRLLPARALGFPTQDKPRLPA